MGFLSVRRDHAKRDSGHANERRLSVWRGALANDAPGQRITLGRVGFSLDFWWLYLVYLGAIPLRIALLAVTAMLAAGAWLTRRVWLDLSR